MATSTTEAEIILVAEGEGLFFLKKLLLELLETVENLLRSTSTKYAVKLAKHREYRRRSKHTEVRHFYVRERFLMEIWNRAYRQDQPGR